MSIIQAAQHAMFIKKDGRRRLFILDEAWSISAKAMVMMLLLTFY